MVLAVTSKAEVTVTPMVYVLTLMAKRSAAGIVMRLLLLRGWVVGWVRRAGACGVLEVRCCRLKG